MGGLTLTAFGALFLPVALALLAWRPRWLAALLVVSAVLQAPAVAVIGLGEGRFGITPFNAACAFFVAGAALLVLRAGDGPSLHRAQWPALQAWTTFLLFSALGSVLLPWLFPDVLVHPLLVRGDIAEPQPNRWSLSHAAQAVNCFALACLFAAFALLRDKRALLRVLVAGLVLALLLSAGVGAWQRMAKWGWLPLHAEFWSSNPTYFQRFELPYWGRVGLPFIEPSYASVWFAVAAGSTYAAAVYGISRHRFWLLGAAALAGAALLNSGGTSGIFAFVLFLAVLLVWHALRGRRIAGAAGNLVVAATLAAIGVVSAAIALDLAWLQLDALAPLRENLAWTMRKLHEESDGLRLRTNLQALGVVAETWGLGAGAGSTRASSYLVSLLANNGLPGMVLFGAALWRQYRALWPAFVGGSPAASAAFGALLAGGIGVTGGIPDQNWPVVWIILLFGFALLPAARERHEAR